MPNKVNRIIFIVCGWGCILVYPFGLVGYFRTDSALTKWGPFVGSSALLALIANTLITVLLGGYAINETVKILKARQKDKD